MHEHERFIEDGIATNQIEALQRRYSELCDQGYPGEEIAALFVEDGVWENHPNGKRCEGQRSIERHFSEGAKRFPWAAHINVPQGIELDLVGGRARGKWFLVMPCIQVVDDVSTGGFYVWRYENDFVIEHGSWRFRHLRVSFELMAPNATDWAETRFDLLGGGRIGEDNAGSLREFSLDAEAGYES